MAKEEVSKDKTDSEVIGEYRLEFERGRNQIEEQRDMCNDDIRFVTTPAAQWEGFLREHFSNRPRYEFDKVSQAINKFYGEWLTNRFSVKYRPENGKAEKEADIMTGLYRKDERRCGGDFAVDNAVLEAVQGGMGAWKYSTEYVDEEDDENDSQNIIMEPIYSAHASLVWDPNAKRMDKADAKWCYILHELDRESYVSQFPDAEVANFAWANDRREFNWNTNSESYFVAERYGVVIEKTKAITYEHPTTGERQTHYKEGIKDVMDELSDQGFKLIKEKKVTRRSVEKCIIGGSNGYLEKPERILGKNIPITPIYAYWTYTDGQEFFWGLVRKLKDAQRLLNMQVSSLAEIAATSVKNVPIFTPEQVSGHELNWAQAHLGKKNYQLANPLRNPDGSVAHLGPIGNVTPPMVDPALGALIEVTGNHIQQETGGMPQDVVDPDASGKAILAVQQRVDMSTQSIMKNIQKSMRRGGEIYRDMAVENYDEPRVMTLLGEDDTESNIKLFESAIDTETGKIVQLNDITEDKFEVIVDTGPAYASRRQETVQNLSEIMQTIGTNPAAAPYFDPILSMMIDNIDGTNLDNLKDFNNQQMILKGMKQPETDEEIEMLEQAKAEQGQDQDPMVMEGQARIMEGQAAMQNEENDRVSNEIDMFKAQTDRMGVQVKAAQAGVKIENTQADTMGKMIGNQGAMIDNAGKKVDIQRRLLEPIAIQ